VSEKKRNTHVIVRYVQVIFLAVCLYALAAVLVLFRTAVVLKTVSITHFENRQSFPVAISRPGRLNTLMTPFHTTFNFYCNSWNTRNPFEIVPGETYNVLLGDSMVFGFGLEDSETLAHFLNMFRSPSLPVFVCLARPSVNIRDTVGFFLEKWEWMPPPELIIFEVLLWNDMYNQIQLEGEGRKLVEREYKRLLWPLKHIIRKDWMMRCYMDRIQATALRDMNDERFDFFVRGPLTRLASFAGLKTRIVILSYDIGISQLAGYQDKLIHLCKDKGFTYVSHLDLLPGMLLREKLPDAHPNGKFNEAMARVLVDRFLRPVSAPSEQQ
jgi:hypothetical protein